MALTIHDTPSEMSPAYNELMFVAGSTKVAQTNFRFRCEVLNDSLATLATVEVFPGPDSYMLFDAHRIIENFVTSNPTLTAITTPAACAASWKKYKLKITERYGSPLADGANTSSGFLFAYNGSFKWKDFASYNMDEWFIKTGNTVNFLTNAPDTQYIAENEKAYLHFGCQTDNLARRVRVRTYDLNGNLAQTILIINGNYAFDAGRITRTPAGWNLNDIAAGSIASGTQPFIHTSIGSWKIDITQSDGTTVLTETKTFEARENCSPYTKYRIHFFNAHGGFDSFTFNKKEERKFKIDKSSFEPVYGSIASNLWSYSKTEQRKKDFYIETNETLKLYSDWITETESAWLYDLITSPEIYIEEDNDSDFYSAHIKTSDYTQRNHSSDKIFNLDIELELGKNIRQRW